MRTPTFRCLHRKGKVHSLIRPSGTFSQWEKENQQLQAEPIRACGVMQWIGSPEPYQGV